MVGVALVARPEAHAPFFASAIALGSAVINGATYTVVRATARSEHHLVVVLALVLVSLPVTGVMCALALLAPDPQAWWVWPDASQWWLLAGMTAASIAAQILMTMGMQRETASRATNMFFLGVVLSLAWGQLLGDPPLEVLDLLGAALIVGSITALAWVRGRGAAPGESSRAR
jgi:drug/metabolite transporter (DMT)-like permease